MDNKFFTKQQIEELKKVDILSVLHANGFFVTRLSQNIENETFIFDNESAGLGCGHMHHYPQVPTVLSQSLTRGHSKEFECYPRHYLEDGYNSSVIAMNTLDIILNGFDIPFSFKTSEEQKKVLDGVLNETLTAKKHLIDIDKLKSDFEENKQKKMKRR